MTDALSRIAAARTLLESRPGKPSAAAALGAAAFAATAAVLMAGVVVGPGVRFEAPAVIGQP